MKIIHLVLSLKIGGLENLVLNMAHAQVRKGMEVIVCSLESQDDTCHRIREDGFKVMYLNKRAGKDVRSLWRLYRLLKQENPDILHTHNISPLIYGALAGKLARIKGIINTRHGEVYVKKSSLIWNANNFVVAISNSAKNKLLKHNRIKIEKVKVIYNGIELNKNKEGDRSNAFGHKNGEFIVGTVGRLDPYKDLFTLISGFEKIVYSLPNAVLWIVGDGALKGSLSDFVASKDLNSKVKFWGWQEDLVPINGAMDVFVLPSLTEGISLALLEAMACGRPVVATEVGGNPEVVINEETGLLVPQKDPEKLAKAVISLAQNRDLAKKMGEAGRKRVEEKFSLGRMVNDYQALYEGCLSG